MKVICEYCRHTVTLRGNECPRCHRRIHDLNRYAHREHDDGTDLLVPVTLVTMFDSGSYSPPATSEFSPGGGEYGGGGGSASYDSGSSGSDSGGGSSDS